MLVFNIQLRNNKTSLSRRTTTAATALFIRNVEAKKWCLYWQDKRVYVRKTINKYYAILSLRRRVGTTLQLKGKKGKH